MSERVVDVNGERVYVRRDSERSVTIGPGLVIDPFNVRTWPDEMQQSHRLRRALHELMPDPRYHLEVGTKPDGTPGIRLKSEYGVPEVAQAFMATYREPLITYLTWLEMIDEYSNVAGPVSLNDRSLVGSIDLEEAA